MRKYVTAKHKHDKSRSRYISFLKYHNEWSDELEEKYFPKRVSHPLKMDLFDEEKLVRYTRGKLYKNKLKVSAPKYGDDKKKTYDFYVALMQNVIEVCRLNKWLTRADWLKHGLPMNRLIKEFIQSSVNYSEVLMYYSKKEFDKRKSEHMGR